MLPFDPTTRALQHNSAMYYSNITESCYRQRELQTRTLRHALNIVYSFICVSIIYLFRLWSQCRTVKLFYILIGRLDSITYSFYIMIIFHEALLILITEITSF